MLTFLDVVRIPRRTFQEVFVVATVDNVIKVERYDVTIETVLCFRVRSVTSESCSVNDRKPLRVIANRQHERVDKANPIDFTLSYRAVFVVNWVEKSNLTEAAWLDATFSFLLPTSGVALVKTFLELISPHYKGWIMATN